MPRPLTPEPMPDPTRTAEVLRSFFLAHPEIQLSEAGQRRARLGGQHSGYTLHPDAHKLIGHFWSRDANLVRRILGVRRQSADCVELDVLRMGQTRPLRMRLAPAGSGQPERCDREAFRQALVAAMQREWQGWTLDSEGGSQPEHSAVLRFVLHRQQQMIACAAMASDSHEGGSAQAVLAVLAQALVWAERCREREAASMLSALRLILPPGGEMWLRLLRPGLRTSPPIECYRWDSSAGRLDEIALSDAGNCTSSLRRAPTFTQPTADAATLLERIRCICPQATWESSSEGYGYISVYGLDIVRQSSDPGLSAFTFGVAGEQTPLLPSTEDQFLHWLNAVGQARVPDASRAQPLFALQPERWLAHLLRHDPTAFDTRLRAHPLYGEIPIATPSGDGILDLLAMDPDGRLIVIELKASEHLAFPLQALLYWLQVRQHQVQGDFERLGYFPHCPISPQPPLLWMMAPALRWHPKTGLITRWFAPDIPVELIGLNEQWRQRVQVIFRRGI